MILEIIGAVVLTCIVGYITLFWLAMFSLSDESFFFGLKYYPVDWLLAMALAIVSTVGGWWIWWWLVGSNISISVSTG